MGETTLPEEGRKVAGMDVSEERLMHWVLELEKVAGQLEWLAVRRSQLSEAQFNVVRQANQLLQGSSPGRWGPSTRPCCAAG